jgi:cytochrome c oxidase subunit II
VAENIEENVPLEIVMAAVPTALVLSMFYYGWSGDLVVRNIPRDAMPITVSAQMWSWQFEYPNGKVENELYVPLNKPIKLTLHSRDVTHGFFVAAFGLKRDVIPGRENTLWFQATETATYDIQCSNYCGTRHSAMLSKLHVIPEDEFTKWYNTITPVREINGAQLLKVRGCVSCHTTDGTRLIGPSLKGIFGKKEIVIMRGKEDSVTVDEDFLKRAILTPRFKTVKGFPSGTMPAQEGVLKEEELQRIVDYIKDLQ